MAPVPKFEWSVILRVFWSKPPNPGTCAFRGTSSWGLWSGKLPFDTLCGNSLLHQVRAVGPGLPVSMAGRHCIPLAWDCFLLECSSNVWQHLGTIPAWNAPQRKPRGPNQEPRPCLVSWDETSSRNTSLKGGTAQRWTRGEKEGEHIGSATGDPCTFQFLFLCIDMSGANATTHRTMKLEQWRLSHASIHSTQNHAQNKPNESTLCQKLRCFFLLYEFITPAFLSGK
jgi:hypothetical protein